MRRLTQVQGSQIDESVNDVSRTGNNNSGVRAVESRGCCLHQMSGISSPQVRDMVRRDETVVRGMKIPISENRTCILDRLCNHSRRRKVLMSMSELIQLPNMYQYNDVGLVREVGVDPCDVQSAGEEGWLTLS